MERPNSHQKSQEAEFDLFGEPIVHDPILRERFIEPPFSVLDTKAGAWQNRKRQWKTLGIQSHLGRDGVVTINNSFEGEKYGRKGMPEVSIFDPALCEVLYSWFCPVGGSILDPFAGGSVRGIVANYLGYKYTGIDIRKEQVESNIEQAKELLPDNNQPTWITGDSNKVLEMSEPIKKFDFVFSCPPYADLEVYSDLEDDISTLKYEDFLPVYREIIAKCCTHLKDGGYACFVVGDVRDKKGNYYGFVPDTIKAFVDGGTKFYNDMILLQPLGTAMLRAKRQFEAGKKVVKVHENVLVFKK
jgi:DNA modification methylase